MLALAALGILLAGCSSSSLSSIPGVSSVSKMFGPATQAGADASAAVVPEQVEYECPSVSIRTGAATLAISANNKPQEEGALNMRYQVGIGDTARECRLANGMVTMKVGMQGRVVLGPAGSAGQIDVPLRYAVVHEGPEPKTVTTRLQHVKVVVPDSTPNVLFTHIEDGISFLMPKGSDIDSYVVYIGFDPNAPKPAPARAPARKRG